MSWREINSNRLQHPHDDVWLEFLGSQKIATYTGPRIPLQTCNLLLVFIEAATSGGSKNKREMEQPLTYATFYNHVIRLWESFEGISRKLRCRQGAFSAHFRQSHLPAIRRPVVSQPNIWLDLAERRATSAQCSTWICFFLIHFQGMVYT